MKNKTLKVFAIVCAIALIFSVNAGCKKKDSESDLITDSAKKTVTVGKTTSGAKTASATTTAKQSTQIEENDEEKDTPTDEGETGEYPVDGDAGYEEGDQDEEPFEEEVLDLGGRTIIIAHTYPREGVNELNDLVWARVKMTEEKFNCKVDFIDLAFTNATNEYLKHHVAGLYWADILGRMNTAQGIPLRVINTGFGVPLDDYIDFSKEIYNVPSVEASIWNGKHYGIPENPFNTLLHVMIYNAVILDSEGLEHPYDLFKKGIWTWDRMTDYAQKMTRDLNGDGVPDQWGLTYTIASGYGAQYQEAFLASNMGQAVKKDSDGSYSVGLKEVHALRALQFMQDLVHVYKVVGPDGTYERGEAAMSFAQAGVAIGQLKNGRIPETTRYTVYPKGPDADDYYSHDVGSSFEFVPMTAPDYKASALVAESIYCYWDTSTPHSMSIEDAMIMVLEPNCTYPEDLDVLMTLQYKPFPLYRRHFAKANTIFTGKIMKDINTLYEPLITIIDRYATEMQSAIDTIIAESMGG